MKPRKAVGAGELLTMNYDRADFGIDLIPSKYRKIITDTITFNLWRELI